MHTIYRNQNLMILACFVLFFGLASCYSSEYLSCTINYCPETSNFDVTLPDTKEYFITLGPSSQIALDVWINNDAEQYFTFSMSSSGASITASVLVNGQTLLDPYTAAYVPGYLSIASSSHYLTFMIQNTDSSFSNSVDFSLNLDTITYPAVTKTAVAIIVIAVVIPIVVAAVVIALIVCYIVQRNKRLKLRSVKKVEPIVTPKPLQSHDMSQSQSYSQSPQPGPDLQPIQYSQQYPPQQYLPQQYPPQQYPPQGYGQGFGQPPVYQQSQTQVLGQGY